MTFYDESEQGTNPMQTKMVSNNQVKMATADDDLMSTTKVYGSSKVPNLSPKKLNPQLHNLKLNLANFNLKHTQAVKQTEEKMINLFANSNALPQLPKAALQTHQFKANIPRINMMLADTKTEDESKFKQSFNSFKQKSQSPQRDVSSTLFPSPRLNQQKELNYQMAP